MTHDKEDDNDDDNDDDACAHDIWYEADLTWHITIIASTHNFYFSLNCDIICMRTARTLKPGCISLSAITTNVWQLAIWGSTI